MVLLWRCRPSLGALALVLLPLLSPYLANVSECAKLSPDGGYNVLIALDDEAPPEEMHVIKYLSKLRFAFQVFSAMLRYATDKAFYINHIEIIVPRKWNVPTVPATTQFYESSDIRLSTKFQHVRTDNPHECGGPGNYIELPTELFDYPSMSDKYGGSPRVLMTQWARLRYGVWEEHGHPGNPTFPYYYKNDDSLKWEPTGCSDEPFNGQYFDTNGKPCRLDASEYPGDDCRFHPYMNETQNSATTSLMSVMEVIKSSVDYSMVTDRPPFDIPQLDLYTFTESQFPRLLILLDMESTDTNDSIRPLIQQELDKLFGLGGLVNENVVKLGIFPPRNGGNGIDSRVEWSVLSDDAGLFRIALKDQNYYPNVNETDISVVLVSAIKEISRIPNDVVILLIRRSDRFPHKGQKAYLEEDVATMINESGNVNLFTIEISDNNASFLELESFSRAVRGSYTRIQQGNEVEEKMAPVLQEIIRRCTSATGSQNDGFVNLHRGLLSADQITEVELPDVEHRFAQLEIVVTSSIPLNDLFIQPYPFYSRKAVPSSNIDYRRTWTEGIYRHTLFVNADATNQRKWRVYFTDAADEEVEKLPNDLVRIAVYGWINRTSDPGTIEFQDSIDLNVAYSAPEDFTNSTEPFVKLFVSAFKNGSPVTNLRIQGIIQMVSTDANADIPTFPSIEFFDDGVGYPDIENGDGIYSAMFIPPSDGSFDIRIVSQARGPLSRHDFQDVEASGEPDVHLVHPDQKTGCTVHQMPGFEPSCTNYHVSGGFYQTANLHTGLINVRNISGAIWSKPLRTKDLQGIVDPTTGLATVTFTLPLVLMKNGTIGHPTSFHVYHALNMKELRGPLHDDLRFGIYDIIPSVTTQVLQFYPTTRKLTYYAIVTSDGGKDSEVSNIISLMSHVYEDTETTVSSSTETDATTQGSTIESAYSTRDSWSTAVQDTTISTEKTTSDISTEYTTRSQFSSKMTTMPTTTAHAEELNQPSNDTSNLIVRVIGIAVCLLFGLIVVLVSVKIKARCRSDS